MEQTREHDPLFTSNFSLSVTTRTMAGSGVFQTATFIAVLIVGIAMAVIHVIPEETSVVDAITQFFVNLFQLTSTSGLTSKDIAAVNEELLKLPVTEQPDAVLRWASNTFAHGRWVQFTSFGLSGIAITHKIAGMGLKKSIPIVSLDTLHLFPSTYELVHKVVSHFDIKDTLKVYQPSNLTTRAEFETKYGTRLWRASPDVYGYLTKVEPTKRALDELEVLAWVTGRRRSQGGERSALPLVEIDPADRRIKINPMANWVHEDVFHYVKEQKLPYNPLHDEGYTSIGDVVSTEKADVTKDGERGGRFKNQASKECGMHLSTDSSSALKLEKLAERIAYGYEWDRGAQQRARDYNISIVTEENFEEVMSGSDAVLLEVYAPWCAHCRELELPWYAAPLSAYAVPGTDIGMAVALNFSRAKDKVVTGRMDGWQNEVPARYKEAFSATGFPSVYLLMPAESGGVRHVLKFEGDKEKDEIIAWARPHVRGEKRWDA